MAEVPEVTQVLLLLSAFEAPPRGMKRMAVDQGATSRRARVTCGCGRRAGPAGEGPRSQRRPVRPGSRSDPGQRGTRPGGPSRPGFAAASCSHVLAHGCVTPLVTLAPRCRGRREPQSSERVSGRPGPQPATSQRPHASPGRRGPDPKLLPPLWTAPRSPRQQGQQAGNVNRGASVKVRGPRKSPPLGARRPPESPSPHRTLRTVGTADTPVRSGASWMTRSPENT